MIKNYPEWPHSRRSTAIHEAGHAIVAKAFGIRYTGAELAPDGETLDVSGRPASGVLHRPPPRPTDGEPLDAENPLTGLAVMMMASMYLGGLQAELIFHGLPEPQEYLWTDHPDCMNADRTLRLVYPTARLLFECQQWARAILMANWSAVLTVANKLEEQGYLSEDKIDRLSESI